MNKNRKGFTLIELLIVVAIIGIIVAIAIPNLLNAIQRAKQKKSMGDIRSIATAVEAYATDLNYYPTAAGYTLPTGLSASGDLKKIENRISPTYIKVVPLTDGWSSWFLYGATSPSQDYILVSTGKDGKTGTATYGATTNFNDDIIWVDGQFVQYPEGVQN